MDKKIKYSILLSLLSFALWVLSIYQSKLSIGRYGIIESFAPTFYIAFLLLLASSLILRPWKNCAYLLLPQCALLGAFLWLTPILIGGSQVNISHAYTFWGYVDYIISSGHTSVSAMWYHAWPGSWILYSAFTITTGAASNAVIALMPFLWQMLYLPVLYLLMKILSNGDSSQYFWIGIWIFFLGDWVGQNYISAQSMAFFTYLLLIGLFIIGIEKNKQWASKSYTILIVLFAGLAITHILTSLIFIMIALLFFIRKSGSRIVLAILITILLLWNIYAISTTFAFWGGKLVTEGLQIQDLFFSSLVNRFQGSGDRLAIVSIRWYTTLIIIGTCILGYLISFKTEKMRRNHLDVIKILMGASVMTMLLGMGSGDEMPYRIYLLVLPLGVFFAAKILKYRFIKFVLVGLVIVLLPLGIISQYGNQQMDYQSSMDFAALNFFHGITDKGIIAGAAPSWIGDFSSARPFGYYVNQTNYLIIRYEDLIWQHDIVYNNSRALPSLSYGDILYIPFGMRDQKIYNFLYNNTDNYYKIDTILGTSKNVNLVYDNGDMRLYESQNWVDYTSHVL